MTKPLTQIWSFSRAVARGWSWPLSLLVAGIAIFGVPAAQAAANAVTLAPAEGQPVTLDLDQMPVAPDVSEQVYTLRSDAGERQVTVTGYSLAALVDAAGLDPVMIGYLEIARPNGGSLLLSRRQATVPGVFAEGPPVVFRDEQGLHLLRPSAGDSDLNEGDLISLPAGSTLAIQARSGTLIEVRAKASKQNLKVGQEVKFSAILDRAAAGEDLEISWYFDDGGSAKGAEVKHRFRRAGLYDVVLGVTTPGDRVGASATVTVRVGEPVKQGPKRRGGGNNKAKDAPDSGASEGGTGAESGPPAGGSPGPSFTPEPSYNPPAPSPSYSPPQPARPTPEKKRPAPAKEQPKAAEPEPRGDEVVGRLLANTEIADRPLAAVVPEPEAKPEQSQPVAARTGSADPVGAGGGVPGAALGIGAALAMLGLGGLLEARGIGRLRW